VEYKLKLSPSPERLTRLITQLKWRLLEGGGQALYEIGVGDAGQLIGLPRHEMEGSLDALEKMAGELGATVMILREIVVPHGVVANTGGEAIDEGGTTRRGLVSGASPTLLDAPHTSRSTSASGSGSGSGSGDELETFPLELDGVDGKPTGPTSWTAQAQLSKTMQGANWPSKSRRRGTKFAQKAEHKKIRRAVKRGVNAAFAVNAGTSLTPRLGRDALVESGAFDTPAIVVSNNVPSLIPPVFGIPEVVASRVPETSLPDLEATDTVAVPFELAEQFSTKSVPDPDEVIIVEALVLRKLALEEAFLDFGGFSVLE
jgi:hypothetical protein